jgi:hypothetical protein
MTNAWAIEQLSKMKQKEILKKAETCRLSQESNPGRRKPYRGPSALCDKLDRLLIRWAASSTFGQSLRWRWKTRGSP